MESSINDLLVEAATLMLVGMSVVFVFLTLLIGAVRLIAFVDSVLPQQASAGQGHQDTTARRRQNQTKQAPPIAAIAAAIHHYRKKH